MCSVPCVSDSEGCGGTSGGSPAAAVDCVSDGGLPGGESSAQLLGLVVVRSEDRLLTEAADDLQSDLQPAPTAPTEARAVLACEGGGGRS